MLRFLFNSEYKKKNLIWDNILYFFAFSCLIEVLVLKICISKGCRGRFYKKSLPSFMEFR